MRTIGWLGDCYNLSCILYEKPEKGGESINIGSSRSFDLAVRRYHGHELLIEVQGVIDPTCFDHSKEAEGQGDVITVCTDRASELTNSKLLRILKFGPSIQVEFD